jgi:secondary thiamine-phosphate synthase enzyme
MKSYTKELTLTVPERMEFVHITPEVEQAVQESGVREGLCLVNAMHITASVFINDNESGLHRDYKKWLEELAPFDASPSATTTTAPARTTPTPTTSARSWDAR